MYVCIISVDEIDHEKLLYSLSLCIHKVIGMQNVCKSSLYQKATGKFLSTYKKCHT